jgi:lipoate-protein ligase B
MNNNGRRRLLRLNLGLTKYEETWKLQKHLLNLRAANKVDDLLLVTEHDPVITMGRGGSKEHLLETPKNLLKRGIEIFEIERGGDITFHGPGQTVLYPIIDLRNRGGDVHQYLRDLERSVINGLDEFGLEATTKEGMTGIWVDDKKIGAIGVAVSRWITYHGLALNVSTDLDYFKLIVPCGITDYSVGTISGLLDEVVKLDEVNDIIAAHFADFFGYDMSVANVSDELFAASDRSL